MRVAVVEQKAVEEEQGKQGGQCSRGFEELGRMCAADGTTAVDYIAGRKEPCGVHVVGLSGDVL